MKVTKAHLRPTTKMDPWTELIIQKPRTQLAVLPSLRMKKALHINVMPPRLLQSQTLITHM